MQTILVTGATGKTGGACASYLLSSGSVKVQCLVRDCSSAAALKLAECGAELVEGQFGETSSLVSACAKVDAAFLVCSNHLDQVELETAFIEAAASSNSVRYIVKVSTCGCADYCTADSPVEYGRMHAQIEANLAAAQKDLAWTVIRPNYFFQNHAGDIFGTLPAKLLTYPRSLTTLETGKARTVDTRDVGEVAAKLLLLECSTRTPGLGAWDAPEAASHAVSHYSQVYDVCGPTAWSVRGLAALYEEKLSLPSGAIRTPALTEEKAAAGLEQAGFPPWLARAVTIGNARYWAKELCDYPSSPAVLAIHPTFRTFEAWVDEHVPMVSFAE